MNDERTPQPVTEMGDARGGSNEPVPVPAWDDCELFCISDYAGVGGRRCGWRGRFDETRWDVSRKVRPCPRCGEATLMELELLQKQFGD